MDMGHLYHDAVYGDPILALDVKEQLRTREINACEEMHLARKSQIYDRAKDLCEKTSNQEKSRVGQTINVILERSPHLEQSLALEKARLETLHNIFVRREAAKKAKESSSLYATTVASSLSRLTLSSKRPSTRKGRSALKGIGRRRRQDRVKSKNKRTKEDGPILNTDFSLDRHLPKTSLYSKRNEHAVKTLARISWQMETRKRDHRRFQENLVHFSKPMMERARMILRGRPDIDVEQFLQEFQDFLYPKEKAETKGGHRKSKRKRSAENDMSVPSDDPSQGTLVQRSEEEEEEDYLPLTPADSSYHRLNSSRDYLGHLSIDPSALPSDQTVHFNQFPQPDHDFMAQVLPSKLGSLTLSPMDNPDEAHTKLLGDDPERVDATTSPSKTRPSSEREGSFHLPAIVATKSDVMNLRSRPGSSAGVSELSRGESSKVDASQASLADAVALRMKNVDLNNNECHSSSSGSSNNNRSLKTDNSIMETNDSEGYNPSSKKFAVESNELSLSGIVSHSGSSPSREEQKVESKRGIQRENNERAFKTESLPPNDSAGRQSSSPADANNHAELYKNSRKSTSKSAGLSSTPSTILSQIIMEEEESERQTRGTSSTISTSPSHSNQKLSGRSGHNGKHETVASSDGGAYIQRLPPLKTHSKSFNSSNIPGDLVYANRELPNSGRNQSLLRSKPEFADLSTMKGKRQVVKNSDILASDNKTKKYREVNSTAQNSIRKKDASNGSLEYDQKDTHHSLLSSRESKDKSYRFNSRNFPSRSVSNPRDLSLGSPERGSFFPNLSNQRGQGIGSDVSVSNGGNISEDTTENGGTGNETYALPSTIGLPKVWKQSMDKKKDPRVEPEVSAAAIARKHRRSRMNSHSIF